MSGKKKLLIAVLVLLLAAGAVTGAYFILRANREPAKVYSVSEISEDSYDDYQNMVGGEIRTDRLQVAFPSDTQQINEVLVQEGDQVKKGDVLIRYSTTLTELQLQRKELEIAQKEEELEKNQRSYQRYFGKRYQLPVPQSQGQGKPRGAGELPGGVRLELLSAPLYLGEPGPGTEPTEPVTESTEPVTEPTEPVTEPTEPVTEPTEPVTEPTEPVTEPTETVPESTEAPDPNLVETIAYVAGSGTREDPALYVIAEDYALSREELEALLGDRQELNLVLANTLDNRIDSPVTSAWGMSLFSTEQGWSFRLSDASSYVGAPLAPAEPEDPQEPDWPVEPDYPVIPDNPSGPSWEELQQLRKELEEKIRDLDLEIRMAKAEYKAMEKEMGSGDLRAEFDGVVLTLNDPDYAMESGEPLIKVSGGGGYSVVCNVSELQLRYVTPGKTVTVSSWYGGEYPATVKEISPYPSSGYYDPYQNVSYYPVTLEVDASANLGEEYWVDVNLGSDKPSGGSYYLFKAFVLTESGKSYVYVRGEDGLLEKRYLNTGRDMYGYMIEILGGLDRDEMIAFPYAKSTQEGAKTQEGKLQELYGY